MTVRDSVRVIVRVRVRLSLRVKVSASVFLDIDLYDDDYLPPPSFGVSFSPLPIVTTTLLLPTHLCFDLSGR